MIRKGRARPPTTVSHLTNAISDEIYGGVNIPTFAISKESRLKIQGEISTNPFDSFLLISQMFMEQSKIPQDIHQS